MCEQMPHVTYDNFNLNYVRILKLKLTHIEDKILSNNSDAIDEDIIAINKLISACIKRHNESPNKNNKQCTNISRQTQTYDKHDDVNKYCLVSSDDDSSDDDNEYNNIKYDLDYLLSNNDSDSDNKSNDDKLNENDKLNDNDKPNDDDIKLINERDDMIRHTLDTLNIYKSSRDIINVICEDDEDECEDDENDNENNKNNASITTVDKLISDDDNASIPSIDNSVSNNDNASISTANVSAVDEVLIPTANVSVSIDEVLIPTVDNSVSNDEMSNVEITVLNDEI